MKTTWSNLNNDLKTQCDFAVGGITRTPQRAALFHLSDNLLPNHKVPIFSKENNAYFVSFNAIDRKGVIVLENKGGTNEPFAQSHIKNASITILPQNEQVYACLSKYPGRHYVMFTDAIEVQYRTHKADSLLSSKGLQVHIPDNPSSDKVFMSNKTPAGQKLMQTFNAFYKQHKADAANWYQEALNIDYPHVSVECPIAYID